MEEGGFGVTGCWTEVGLEGEDAATSATNLMEEDPKASTVVEDDEAEGKF